MDTAVTARTGRKFFARGAPLSFRAMHAYGLLGKYVGMAIPTVHGIEPAPVPAFRADMAVDASGRTVWRAFEVSHINFVAIVTGILFHGIGRRHPEKQAANEQGQGNSHENDLSLASLR
jgi:hypothetical protein